MAWRWRGWPIRFLNSQIFISVFQSLHVLSPPFVEVDCSPPTIYVATVNCWFSALSSKMFLQKCHHLWFSLPTMSSPLMNPTPAPIRMSSPLMNPTPAPIRMSSPLLNPAPAPLQMSSPLVNPAPAPIHMYRYHHQQGKNPSLCCTELCALRT